MIGNLSDTQAHAFLDSLWGSGAPANHFFALYTAAPGNGGGGTEVAAGGYARLSVTNNVTNFPAAVTRVKSLAVQHDFAAASANWGEIVAVGDFSASSGGTFYAWFWLTDSTPLVVPGTAAAGTDNFTSYAHGLANTERVVLEAPNGGTLPTGVTAQTAYFVISAAADTFQLSLTSGGAAINLTSDGEFIAFRIKPVTINNLDTFRVPANSVKFSILP